MTKPFSDLLTESAGSSFEKQHFLGQLIGDHSWELDLDKGRLSFGSGHEWDIQVLGTESEVSNTWLWAWANKDWGLSPPLMACAEKLRQRGESQGIEEFVTPKFSLDPVNGHQVATVASALCEANCYYRGPYEKGAVFLLIKDPAFEKPSEDPALTITTVFTQVIGAFNVDHRKAFLGYLSYHGIDAQESDSKVTGKSVHGTEVVAQFDASGRLQDLSANL